MKKLKFNITKKDGIELSAKMDVPDSGEPVSFGIFAHCFTCGKDLKLIKYISEILAESRISLLRFDFTGLGESGGNFADTTFEGAAADLLVASDYLSAHYASPTFMIGHSMGGPVTLAAAKQLDTVKAVILIASSDNLRNFSEMLFAKKASPQPDGSYIVTISGRKFNLKKPFFDSLMNSDVISLVKALGKPLLILHAVGDRTVDITSAHSIFEAAAYPKAIVTIDGNEHLFSDRNDADYLGRLIKSWISAYI